MCECEMTPPHKEDCFCICHTNKCNCLEKTQIGLPQHDPDCPLAPTNNTIESIVAEFMRYENDTDWQEMHGGDLVDIAPEKWLRTTLITHRLSVLAEEIKWLENALDDGRPLGDLVKERLSALKSPK